MLRDRCIRIEACSSLVFGLPMVLRSFHRPYLQTGLWTTPVPAMPHLDELFTQARMDELIVDLFGLARNYFERSLTVTENVTRVPIKVGEQQLPSTAADGLRYFTPVDIYDHNVACT